MNNRKEQESICAGCRLIVQASLEVASCSRSITCWAWWNTSHLPVRVHPQQPVKSVVSTRTKQFVWLCPIYSSKCCISLLLVYHAAVSNYHKIYCSFSPRLNLSTPLKPAISTAQNMGKGRMITSPSGGTPPHCTLPCYLPWLWWQGHGSHQSPWEHFEKVKRMLASSWRGNV